MFENQKRKKKSSEIYKYLNIENLHQELKQSVFNGCKEKWALYATGRFKKDFSSKPCYGKASYFENLNLICMKNYFKKKSHPQV